MRRLKAQTEGEGAKGEGEVGDLNGEEAGEIGRAVVQGAAGQEADEVELAVVEKATEKLRLAIGEDEGGEGDEGLAIRAVLKTLAISGTRPGRPKRCLVTRLRHFRPRARLPPVSLLSKATNHPALPLALRVRMTRAIRTRMTRLAVYPPTMLLRLFQRRSIHLHARRQSR